ncbi:MAG TPA: glycoside hydrolase family 3 C-terminal domain-containing protein [Acidobacteriaceae bacterium]|jgi:beta-glucosidase|nr:glycoside hydrolase family 3 C-terminal domain-containing protein [Acidobacteriaceae bacterium]
MQLRRSLVVAWAGLLPALLVPVLSAPVLSAQSSSSPGAQKQIWFDASQPIDKRVDALVSAMTLEEKAAQMVNGAPAIPRLGIPAYDYWSEGLHGIARSGYATLFPQAIGLAATFDPSLQHQVATVISTEARAKYNQAMRDNLHSIFYGLTIWSPNINIFRDPRWGRGQETYGEDPFLTSRMGVAFVRGLQGDDPHYFRTISTPKHYAVHSGPEPMRHQFNVDVSPRDLEDTYLPAFRATVTEGHADSVMCAYNAIDGAPACANKMLLDRYLRGDWHFQGFVTSDCGAIDDFFSPTGHHYSPDAAHASAAAVEAGTDTNCGKTYLSLVQAVHQGLISESTVDQSLRRLFTARIKLGMFDLPSEVKYAQIPFSVVDAPEHRQLALEAEEKAIVLLKNDGILPLQTGLRRVAVIGPNAATLAAVEGNYNAIPSHPSLPVDGIEEALRGRASVVYAEGSAYVDGLAAVLPRTALHPQAGSRELGLRGEYFSNPNFTGAPVVTRVDKQIDFDWDAASPARGLPMSGYSVRWTGAFTAPAPGKYELAVRRRGCYRCGDQETYTLWFDGKQIYDSATEMQNFRAHPGAGAEVDIADAAPHSIRIDYVFKAPLFGSGLTLEWKAPAEALRAEAVAAAKSADVVLAFVGISPNLEGEEMPVHVEGFSGGDRTSIDLPQTQQDLLEAVAATGKPVVVVLMSGSALAMDWSKAHAAALLEAWYPGEAGGEAIAAVLTGKVDPSGHLPITFYASDSQLPPFTDYSMKNRTYRYFEGAPLYPFGYGLSYTTFYYSELKLSSSSLRAGEPLQAEVTVTNSGDREGDAVAQAYLIPPQGNGYPLRSLEGFERVHLAPHASAVVHFTLDARDLSEVDAGGHRAVRAGDYRLFAGSASPEAQEPADGSTAQFTITGSQSLPE